MWAHMVGVVVRETTRETSTATERVTANSLNSLPIRPPMPSTGMKMATREKLIEITVKATSRLPRWAAGRGAMPPST